jgi:hypothetical protein
VGGEESFDAVHTSLAEVVLIIVPRRLSCRRSTRTTIYVSISLNLFASGRAWEADISPRGYEFVAYGLMHELRSEVSQALSPEVEPGILRYVEPGILRYVGTEDNSGRVRGRNPGIGAHRAVSTMDKP